MSKKTDLFGRARRLLRLGPLVFAGLLGACAESPRAAGPEAAECGPAGRWVNPDTGAILANNQVIDALSGRSAVLLGESHTSAEHHRWQLSVLSALHGRNPQLAVGFESFPRRVQPVLDEWSQGKLDTDAFLEKVEWDKVWGTDPDLYLPLLQFARLHRLPVVALNVERSLVSEIGEKGLDEIATDAREGVGVPAPPAEAYRERLAEVYAGHLSAPPTVHGDSSDEAAEEPDIEAVMEEPRFRNFVQAQQFWDRAMAEAIRDAARRDGVTQVVGIIGQGHLVYGHGVPAQLEEMGIDDATVLIPAEIPEDCDLTDEGLAQAVFLIAPVAERQKAPRLRLGVYLESVEGGVRVEGVVDGSVAKAAGIEEGDVIVEAAGSPVDGSSALIEIVGRQAPGTWLPLTVERDGDSVDLVAKFGPLAP